MLRSISSPLHKVAYNLPLSSSAVTSSPLKQVIDIVLVVRLVDRRRWWVWNYNVCGSGSQTVLVAARVTE